MQLKANRETGSPHSFRADRGVKPLAVSGRFASLIVPGNEYVRLIARRAVEDFVRFEAIRLVGNQVDPQLSRGLARFPQGPGRQWLSVEPPGHGLRFSRISQLDEFLV